MFYRNNYGVSNMEKKIIKNKAQCKKCKDIIESKATNDLKKCSCSSIAMDGGLEHIKRIGNLDDVIELSEYEKEKQNGSLPNTLNLNSIKKDFSSIKFNTIVPDNVNKRIISSMESTNRLNDSIIKNISFPFQELSKSVISSLNPIYFSLNQRLVQTIKPIISMQTEMISNIVKQMNPMQEIAKKLSEALKPITSQVIDSLPKMTSYFSELSNSLEKAKENPDSLLNWIEYSEKLSEYIWTIPYDISSEELKSLTSVVNSEKEFDKYMLRYFDKTKLEKMFDELLSRIPYKHKTIFKQIRNSFYQKDYALANTGILSVIDELCSQFLLDKGCLKRKDILLPIVEMINNTSDDNFEVIPILVLNDNINTIYESVDFNKRIKIKTNKKVRRNPSQHGRYFSNRKIDTIMLLNTVYYLLIVMDTYKQYVGKIIYVRNSTELGFANTIYSSEVKRFYIRKKYIRKNKK